MSRKSTCDLNFPQKIPTKPSREPKIRIVLFREKPVGSGSAGLGKYTTYLLKTGVFSRGSDSPLTPAFPAVGGNAAVARFDGGEGADFGTGSSCVKGHDPYGPTTNTMVILRCRALFHTHPRILHASATRDTATRYAALRVVAFCSSRVWRTFQNASVMRASRRSCTVFRSQ